MSKKVGAIVRCYGLTRWLKAVLKSLSHLDVVVLANQRFDGVPEREDKTEQIFKDLKQKNVTLIKGDGGMQHDLFNKILNTLSGLDYVFINDADEFISRPDRDTMVAYLKNNSFDGGTCVVVDYKKGLDTAYLERTHRPTVIVRPHVRFFDTRGASYSNHFFKDIHMHHFGYHRDNELGWKRENLWYKKDSMDNAMNGERKVTPPEWLKDALEDK